MREALTYLALAICLLMIGLAQSSQAQDVRCTIVAPAPKADCTLKGYFARKGASAVECNEA